MDHPPTGIVATTVLVAGFITETVFESALATYTKPLVGINSNSKWSITNRYSIPISIY